MRARRQLARHNREMEIGRPEPELLDHLSVEFGPHGRRAVEFLITAESSRIRAQWRLRLAGSIAYCLREAMKAIPASQDTGDGGLWKRASHEVEAGGRATSWQRACPARTSKGRWTTC